MPNQNELIVEEWFKRAEEDELSIGAILEEEGGAPSTVCFLSHQMAEKYLKAFLIVKKREFPKIHLLDRLLELCINIDSDFEQLKIEAVALNDYYIDTRYPGDYPQFSFKQAREAFEKALKIKEFVLKKII